MAGLEMCLNYRICGPPSYAVHLLAAARTILDAVVCLLIPIHRICIWASARGNTIFKWCPTRHGKSSAARLFPSATQGLVLVCVTERQDSRPSPVRPSVECEAGNKSSRPPSHRTLSPQPAVETCKPKRPQ